MEDMEHSITISFRRKSLAVGIAGFVTGCLFTFAVMLLGAIRWMHPLFDIILPVKILSPIASLDDRILHAVCDLLGRSDLCVGLGYDGGPLVWFEYVWTFFVVGLYYALLFEVVFFLYRWFQSRFKKS